MRPASFFFLSSKRIDQLVNTSLMRNMRDNSLTGARRRRHILIGDPLDGCAAVAFQLRLDPVDGVAIALGALPAIAELRQSLDRRFVLVQVEPTDKGTDRVRLGGRRRLLCKNR